MEIKVSVIIPVYNTEKYLKACLDTVVGQTLREIEILCVDDGSTDGSLAILQEYAARDRRVRILSHPHTELGGAAGARNMGLAEANGAYVSLLDSDDRFDLTMLERTYQKAVAVNADVVMYDGERFDSENGNPVYSGSILNDACLPDKDVFSWRDYPDYIFQSTAGPAWAILIRNQCIQANQLAFQSVYGSDDHFFTYCALASAKQVTAIKEKVVYYRVHQVDKQNQMSNIRRKPLAAVEVCQQLRDWLCQNDLYRIFRISYLNITAAICRWYLYALPSPENTIFYNCLHERALKDLNLLDASLNDFHDPTLFQWCQNVQKVNAEEFQRGIEDFQYISHYSFPKDIVQPSDRVVLYGAGEIGKSYFIQNLVYRYCDIILWVDRNYLELGNLVQAPQEVCRQDCAKIIIAIESFPIYQKIREQLINLGISHEKIIWPFTR